jgi:hypothetical protein
VPITTKVVSSNPAHGEVYSIQHYVISIPLENSADGEKIELAIQTALEEAE